MGRTAVDFRLEDQLASTLTKEPLTGLLPFMRSDV